MESGLPRLKNDCWIKILKYKKGKRNCPYIYHWWPRLVTSCILFLTFLCAMQLLKWGIIIYSDYWEFWLTWSAFQNRLFHSGLAFHHTDILWQAPFLLQNINFLIFNYDWYTNEHACSSTLYIFWNITLHFLRFISQRLGGFFCLDGFFSPL